MGVVYSNSADSYIDLDTTEATYIDATDDWIANDNTDALLEAYDEGHISEEIMLGELGFTEEDLEDR